MLKKIIELKTKKIAQVYLKFKKPTTIAIAGSVGKTSTKGYLANLLLENGFNVRWMDDSYNNGLGLYLSVFSLKVPSDIKSISGWFGIFCNIIFEFFKKTPDYLILEYGIDHPGDMDDLIKFHAPNISMLTAVTPEHMEYMKTLDNVKNEELKIVYGARDWSIVNCVDMPGSMPKFDKKVYFYGDVDSDAWFEVERITTGGSEVNFYTVNNKYNKIHSLILSKELLRQMSGVLLLAEKLGVNKDDIERSIANIEPANSRMRLLKGVNNSFILDDSANFSPSAGISALKTLIQIDSKHKLAVLGNMHELGAEVSESFKQISEYINITEIEKVVLVGDIVSKYLTPILVKKGYVKDESLFIFNTSIEAGVYIRDNIDIQDYTILVKGPFGGFYLEEVSRMLLRDRGDINKITRQSNFWHKKKSKIFGEGYLNL